MQVRIKKTGEVINTAEWATVKLDKCDSFGNPIEFGFDDVEFIQNANMGVDWEQRRYEIAKSVVIGLLASPIIPGVDPNPSIEEVARHSVLISNSLIAELKSNES